MGFYMNSKEGKKMGFSKWAIGLRNITVYVFQTCTFCYTFCVDHQGAKYILSGNILMFKLIYVFLNDIYTYLPPMFVYSVTMLNIFKTTCMTNCSAVMNDHHWKKERPGHTWNFESVSSFFQLLKGGITWILLLNHNQYSF